MSFLASDHFPKEFISRSSEETIEFGRLLGHQLDIPSVICFFGDLGAGKTTLIKGLIEGATQLEGVVVQSPTFTYLNSYEGEKNVYHFDLYRLRSIDEFLSMGFDDYFEADGLCCVEWSEKIASYIPSNALRIKIVSLAENERLITFDIQPRV